MPKDIMTINRDQLRDPVYLKTFLQDHHLKGPEEFRIALREAVLSQAGGFAELSRRTGLARTGLYKALSAHGNPSYRTVYQILEALGMSTVITSKEIRPSGRRVTKTPKTNMNDQNTNKVTKPRILPGSAKGVFVMSEDFDAPLSEFSEYI
ncbi:MAG: hypothetical protein ABJA67_18720 [Chthonomonadales bacterium]